MGQGEGPNLRQRVRHIYLRVDVMPDKGLVVIWRYGGVAGFEVTVDLVILVAKEAPRADPHAGCCGEGGVETRPYLTRLAAFL